MDALDVAFNTLKKSVGVIPSESVSKKSQTQLNRERKRKMRQAKKEEEAGIPPLPGTGWRRVKEGSVPPGEDPKNYVDYEIGADDHVARRKKGPYSGGDTDIFEFVDGEWKPTEEEMEPMGHLWEPTGRRQITGVKRRADESAKRRAQYTADSLAARKPYPPGAKTIVGPDKDWFSVIGSPKDAPMALPPPSGKETTQEDSPSGFSNWIRKPLDAAYQRLFDKPSKEEEPEQVTAE